MGKPQSVPRKGVYPLMAGLPWQRGSTRPPGCHSGFPVPATLFVLGRHPGEFEGVREAGGRSSREFTGVRGSRGEPYRLQATQTPCRVSQTAWAAGGVGREQEEGKMEPVRDNPRGSSRGALTGATGVMRAIALMRFSYSIFCYLLSLAIFWSRGHSSGGRRLEAGGAMPRSAQRRERLPGAPAARHLGSAA